MESLLPFLFPEKGLDVAASYSEQPPGTTPLATNVRLYEPRTQRARGGARQGLSRYIDAQASGANLIQHLTTIVSVSGEALGWAFEGRDFGDPGNLGIDFGPAGISGAEFGPVGGGGGGYQPSVSFQENRASIVLVTSHSTRPADGTTVATLTATVTKAGSPQFARTVVLGTTPSGVTGDGEVSITTIAGQATFDVTHDVEETVTYVAGIKITGSTRYEARSNAVTVEYGGIEFVQATDDGFTNATNIKTLAFDSDVVEGNLLLVALSTFSIANTATITDDLGNSYTQCGSYKNGNSARVSLWQAISIASGPCTVTVTLAAADFCGIGLLEYSGADQISPLDSTASNNGTATTWTTTSIPVTGSSDLLVGVFAQGFWDLSLVNFTPDAGYNLRCHQPDSVSLMSIYVIDKLSVTADEALSGTVDVPLLPYAALGASFKP